MENFNVDEIADWVRTKLSYLDPPASHNPGAADGLLRIHRRMDASGRRTFQQLWPAWAAALLGVVFVVLILPAGRVAAQEFWQFLTVRQVRFIRVNSWPRGVPSPQAKLLGTVIPPIPARDAADAAGRVHYQPRLPGASVLLGTPRLSTTFSMAAGLSVHIADLELALEKAGVKDQTVPELWEGARLALHTSGMVIAEWPDAVLIQSLPFTLTAPPGFDFPAFSSLVLRILGVGPEEARTLAEKMGTTPPWLAPIEPELEKSLLLEEISLRSGPATLVQEKRDDKKASRVTVFWNFADRVFLLSGTLSREILVEAANAVQ